MEYFPQLILVVILILLNGFFAAAEYAIVAVRKTRIDDLVKKGDFIAKLVQQALEKREDYISATQLGVTFVSLMLGWIGEPVVAKLIGSLLFFIPNPIAYFTTHTLSIIIAFFILTYLSIVVGELIPKTIAVQRAEVVALMTIAPLSFFTKALKPFVSFLNRSGNVILKLLGFKTLTNTPLIYSKDEVKLILDEISQSGAIAKEEMKIIDNVFKLSDKMIRQMITPRSDLVSVNADMTISQIADKMDHQYSRFPVYRGNRDNIIGFIHIKDVYRLAQQKEKDKKLIQTGVIRKLISVPETKKASEMLLDMRKKHVHLATVYDEFGVMIGVVTLEDIIESLVGNIQDEFDKPIPLIQRNIDGSYLIDGNAPVEVIQRRFHLPIKGQSYNTIGGLFFGLLGRGPSKGDVITIGQMSFEADGVEGKRIKKLLMYREGDRQPKHKDR